MLRGARHPETGALELVYRGRKVRHLRDGHVQHRAGGRLVRAHANAGSARLRTHAHAGGARLRDDDAGRTHDLR